MGSVYIRQVLNYSSTIAVNSILSRFRQNRADQRRIIKVILQTSQRKILNPKWTRLHPKLSLKVKFKLKLIQSELGMPAVDLFDFAEEDDPLSPRTSKTRFVLAIISQNALIFSFIIYIRFDWLVVVDDEEAGLDYDGDVDFAVVALGQGWLVLVTAVTTSAVLNGEMTVNIKFFIDIKLFKRVISVIL